MRKMHSTMEVLRCCSQNSLSFSLAFALFLFHILSSSLRCFLDIFAFVAEEDGEYGEECGDAFNTSTKQFV